MNISQLKLRSEKIDDGGGGGGGGGDDDDDDTEIQRIWNLRTRVILVIIGAFQNHSENM